MSNVKHTPGPWSSASDGAEVFSPELAPICFVHGANIESQYRTSENVLANAQLIAAAPDLLAACKRVLGWLIDAETELGGPLPLKYAAMIQKPVVAEILRDVIAQAEGC